MDPHAIETNRANWDARAAVHGQDRIYDSDGLVAGRIDLDELEEAALLRAVGDVAGLGICHLQCHIGFDSILLARRGARVTAIDFSPVALAKAADLAQRCGVALELVEANACDPPRRLEAGFDVVYATIGVLCWIERVDEWMAAAARLARPGGHLVLVEIHPLASMFDTFEPPVTDFPYNFDGPHHFDSDGSYTDPGLRLSATETVQYAHGLGEIVTAAVEAGWEIEHLAEHTFSPGDYWGNLTSPDEDGRYRVRLGDQPIPLLFTLLARRE
jgi:2-polyprenyl-3-methyl-5-hydroxy-6-metoxy-1,4-benzoquinol methylase